LIDKYQINGSCIKKSDANNKSNQNDINMNKKSKVPLLFEMRKHIINMIKELL